MNYKIPPKGSYILAVSGGVDSVVLLDLLANHMLKSTVSASTDLRLVVAHVDHGIRDDSAANARFVQALASKYGVAFELLTLQLGANASEEAGRNARYSFFENLRQKHAADAVMTAHHANDAVETIVMNIVRGTGWRGLASLRSHDTRIRPLLDVPKAQIVDYAVANCLEWYEDSTNTTDDYTRNKIRRHVIPVARQSDEQFETKLLTAHQQQQKLRTEIEQLARALYETITAADGIARHRVCALEPELQAEMLRLLYASNGVAQTRPQVSRAIHFMATATNGQRFSIDGQHFLEVKAGNLVVSYRKN